MSNVIRSTELPGSPGVKEVRLRVGVVHPEAFDPAGVFLGLVGGDTVRLSSADARLVASRVLESADLVDQENNGQAVAASSSTAAPQNLLVGLSIGENGRAFRVCVVPTYGPEFYTDAVGALNLARLLTERAHELLRAQPLPEPCPLCGGGSQAFVPGTADHGGGETDCPLCSPEDPASPGA